MKNRVNNLSIESILVMILLVIFASAMSIVIIRGSESYDRLLTNKESEENARIALSYVNMMVRQNDEIGAVDLRKASVEGIDAIVIKHHGVEAAYTTYIYYYDGYLWTCYTDEIPTRDLSDAIVPVVDLSYILVDDMITVKVSFKDNDKSSELVRYIGLRADKVM